MMSSSVQQALGQVFSFIGEVASSIRMNSAYAGDDNRLYRDGDVMFLADLIHHMEEFGRAVSSGDPEKLRLHTEKYLSHIRMIKASKDDDPRRTVAGYPAYETFQREWNTHLLRAGEEAFRELRHALADDDVNTPESPKR